MTVSTQTGLAIVGGGPAGLMAAEAAIAAGLRVDLYDAVGSVGRKFLLAGKGGLNLTHSDPRDRFAARYDAREVEIARWLDRFDAQALRDWARGLGVDTFVGSSGRVFPTDLKAAPLLRRWVRRLRDAGVGFHMHHRWLGWSEDGRLRFAHPDGPREVEADAVVLALGGGSWPMLGSDGAWQAPLAARGVALAPLVSSNCGFDVGWSAYFSQRFAGAPIKPVVAVWRDAGGQRHAQQGEFVATADGVEGSLIYALSATLRDAIARDGEASIELDLAPAHPRDRLVNALSRPAGGRTLSERLRRAAGLDAVKIALLHECVGRDALHDPLALAAAIKALPLRLLRPRPLAEAISSSGGVCFDALDDALMLRNLPGTFCAGEMIDWEAPTGGYLLTACFASGRIAGEGAARWLAARAATP